MYKKPHDLSDGLLSSLILEDPDKDGVDLLPSPCKQIVSVVDDLWCMGEHRLLCGDSTNSTAAARIMGSERAHLLFTSPPYGNQRNYATGGIGDWDALMRGVFGRLDEVMVQDGQVLVNLGLVHRDNEWLPYWQGWLDWMRGEGWRSFGLYVWDQGTGIPGDWNGRLAPAFEFIFHFNQHARKPNKIVPCKTAGKIGHAPGTAGMRLKDGSFDTWTHGGAATQPFRIPDSVIRIERHHGVVGRDLSHPRRSRSSLPSTSCVRSATKATWSTSRSAAPAPVSSPVNAPVAGCGPSSWRPNMSISHCCDGNKYFLTYL